MAPFPRRQASPDGLLISVRRGALKKTLTDAYDFLIGLIWARPGPEWSFVRPYSASVFDDAPEVERCDLW